MVIVKAGVPLLPLLRQENSPHVFSTPSWNRRNHNYFGKSKRRQFIQMKYECESKLSHIERLMDALNIIEPYEHGVQGCTHADPIDATITKTGFQSGIFLGNNLLSKYAKCGNLVDARQVFDKMPKRNKVSWSAMIAGYAENGFGREALAVFQRMIKAGMIPNHITFVSVVKGCASVGDLEAGMQVHAWVVKNGFQANICLATALVDLYCNCGTLDYARDLFDEMPERDVVSWTAMIAGYSQQGHGKDALHLFNEMRQMGMTPNEFTVPSVLRACTGLRNIHQGQGLHAYAIKIGMESDAFVGSALVDMYANCGNLADARRIFNQIPQRDEVLWNSMITGCLQWGCCEQALILLSRMRLAGVEPKEFIVNSVMSTCGSQEFNKMKMNVDES